MMQIKLLTVGKIKEKYIKEGIKEYSKRLEGYVKLQIIEVDDEPCPERYSRAEIEKAKQKEGERLLRYVGEQDYLILLDVRGKELSSQEFADILAERSLKGQSRIALIVGGSMGVSDQVLKRADFCWSFSKLTFPHQLFRLMLLEQIYRACKINQGETYHK
ncbi:MAG: 23S rRNA (pseudouridine(1915)-N(3))-methyltransferase RlmH [Peptococcaceae bacterium]|nr:23S rRNA (pseudouridine(1915)-N(3))-methyltransferase RlmH [Peptococcaceae bacterium]